MIVSRTDITLAKVAILLLYLRIFVPRLIGSRKMWLWIWGMIIFNVLYCVFFTLLVELQCIGRKINRSGGCLNMQVLIITAAAINLATEIAILAVAVVAIWGLRLPTTRKIAIIALLTFGLA